MKKRWLTLLAVLVWLLCATGIALARETSGVDVIMILDCSSSMQENDKNKLMVKSAMNFVDMCDVSGTRVSIIPFNSKDIADEWRNTFGFKALNTVNDREELREALLAVNYTGGTDAGAAFRIVQEEYENSRTDSNANESVIVLFFSDGKVAVGDKTNATAKEKQDAKIKTENSRKTVDDVVEYFAAKEVPIYCIGLKGSGDFDEGWLNSIAEIGGTDEARVVRNGNSSILHETFSAIFAAYLGTEPLAVEHSNINVGEDNIAEVVVEIPNNSIMEANIRLSLSNPGDHSAFGSLAGITDPSGRSVEPVLNGVPTAGSVVAGNSGAYYNIKLIRPAQGRWTVRVNVNEVTSVDAEMISNYDIALRWREVPQNPSKNDHLVLEAEFYSSETGASYPDAYLYNPDYITASIVNAPVEGLAFAADTDNHSFRLETDLSVSGDYRFQVEVDGAGIRTQTEEIAFTIENRAPVRIGAEPDALRLSVDTLGWNVAHPDGMINLAEYFRDEDGDPLTYTRSGGNGEIAQCVITGNQLKITALDKGESTFTLKAKDNEDAVSERSLQITVNVSSCAAKTIREGFIFGAAVLILLVLFFLIRHKRRGRFGRSACLKASYNRFTFSMTPLSLIFLSRYDDKKTNLYRVLDDANAGDGSCQEISGEKNGLSRIVFKPERKGKVRFTNDSSFAVSVNGAVLPSGKHCTLNNGANIRIEFSEPDRYIQLMYEHEEGRK